jgi:hypothetical protein
VSLITVREGITVQTEVLTENNYNVEGQVRYRVRVRFKLIRVRDYYSLIPTLSRRSDNSNRKS